MPSWCSTCFTSSTEDPSTTFATLPCKCISCNDCLTSWIATKALEMHFQATEKIPCMTSNCKRLFTPQDVLSQLDKDQQNIINTLLFDVYLRKTPDIRKCPNTACSYAGTIDMTIQCKKPLECSMCGTSWRERIHYTKSEKIKDLVQNTDEKANEFLSGMWEETFTRRCPKCDVMIQKNGGCNFMTCRRCQHEFCWICTQGPTRHNRKFCRVVSLVKGLMLALPMFSILYLVGVVQLITTILRFVIGFFVGAAMFNTVLIMIYVLYTIVHKTNRDRAEGEERRQAEMACFIVTSLMLLLLGMVKVLGMEKHVIRAIIVEAVLAIIFSEYLNTLKYTLKYYLLYSHNISNLLQWKKRMVVNCMRGCLGRQRKNDKKIKNE